VAHLTGKAYINSKACLVVSCFNCNKGWEKYQSQTQSSYGITSIRKLNTIHVVKHSVAWMVHCGTNSSGFSFLRCIRRQ